MAANSYYLQEGTRYPKSYYSATRNFFSGYPQFIGEDTVDVAIIGAGYTGLSAALHLAERGYRVAILEGARVGWGASGRNGGQIHSGQRRDQTYLHSLLGWRTARQLWDLAEDARALVYELIDKHQIECDLRSGLLHGLHRARFIHETQTEVEKLNRDYNYPHIRWVPKDEIRQMVATNDYHGGTFDSGGGHLHPLNYALGLARAATSSGARIFEQSAVTEIIHGDPSVIVTKEGRLRANYVLVACNAYLSGLVPKLESVTMPINNFIVTTVPLTEQQQVIHGDFAVADSRFVVNYYRTTADGRLLFGGGETYSDRFPRDISALVRKPMLSKFPQLRDVEVEYSWGGTLAVTMRRLPCFRQLSPNCFAAIAYNGLGVCLATLGGKILSEAVAGTMERFDVMQSIPLPSFPGGTLLRWPILVAAMSFSALRDRL